MPVLMVDITPYFEPAKFLQSGFYLPTLFKDANELVKNCDACQHMMKIEKRQEMSINYNLILEPFLMFGVWISGDHFLLQMYTVIF
jgi:hypothetical protein